MKSTGPVQLVLALLTISWVSSMPAKESTTRRYNSHVGHNTSNKTRLGISDTNTNQLNTVSPNNILTTPRTYVTTTKYLNRSSKFYTQLLQTFPEAITKRSLPKANFVAKQEVTSVKPPQPIKPKIGVSKIPQVSKSPNKKKPLRQPANDIITIHNFIQSNFEDLNTSNKTIKIVRVNKTSSTVNRVQKPVNNKRTSTSTTIRPLRQRIKTTQRLQNKTNKTPHSTKSNIRQKPPKSTTARPLTSVTKQNKNWPNTIIKNTEDLNRYKNYTELNVKPQKKKPKPTVHKVVSKWSDKPPYNEFKQSWYDNGIPIPHPNPEISTYSPQYPISSALPADADYGISISNLNPEISTYSPQYSISSALPIDVGYDDQISISQVPSIPLGNPLSQVAVDIKPSEQNLQLYSSDDPNSNCPTVHLTSSVYGPSRRQGCSDLNLAINTHIQQNTITELIPAAVESDLFEEAASSGSSEIAAPNLVAADPPVATIADAVPAAAVDAAGTAGGADPATQAIGLPELPGFPNFQSLGQILRLLGFLRYGLGFLRNIFDLLRGALGYLGPLLWILPLLSFGIGFMLVLPFYPWWFPFLFLATKKKETPAPEIVLHHHAHKPIHHDDGWFWNHNTQSWSNVLDYMHGRSNTNDFTNQLSIVITRLIENFGRKYKNESQKSQSWKRRKK